MNTKLLIFQATIKAQLMYSLNAYAINFHSLEQELATVMKCKICVGWRHKLKHGYLHGR